MKTILSVLVAITLVCSSCAAQSVTTGTKQLSRELVDRSIVKGKTTKAQVRALLGEPQTITTSDSDLAGWPAEMWVYRKSFHRDAAEKHGFGAAILYSMANPGSGGYDRTEITVLVVSFDKSGKVLRKNFTTTATGASR